MNKVLKALRHYKNGGVLKFQRGYLKKDGKFVKPYFKTWPDNSLRDNRKSILGY
jgi:hypothetical protein